MKINNFNIIFNTPPKLGRYSYTVFNDEKTVLEHFKNLSDANMWTLKNKHLLKPKKPIKKGA